MDSPLIFLSTRAAMETKREKKVPFIRISTSCRVALLHLRREWIYRHGQIAHDDVHVPQTIYQAVLDIIKKEGVLGMYSGLSSSLLGVAVTNG